MILTVVVQVGIMHIQLLHTSASLTINENWDPDVRDDMEMMLNRYEILYSGKNGNCRKSLCWGRKADRETC